MSEEKLFSRLEKIIEEHPMRGEEGGELSATCVAPRVPLRLRSLSPNQQRGLIELYSQKYAKGEGEERELSLHLECDFD